MQNVVTYGTVIDVPNLEYKLKPGMTANVSIEINKRTDVVRVPNTAIRFRPTAEIFEAFNQEVPPELQPRTGGAQGGTARRHRHGRRVRAERARARAHRRGWRTARLARPATGATPQARAGSETARPSQRGGGDATAPGHGTPQFGASRQGAPDQTQGQRGEGGNRQGMGWRPAAAKAARVARAWAAGAAAAAGSTRTTPRPRSGCSSATRRCRPTRRRSTPPG